MRLSVIINTYNRPEQLARCLGALGEQRAGAPFEVIAVDDGGARDLEPVKRSFAGRLDLRLIRIAHAGRGGARNRGVAEARGRRVLFLGDDVLVRPGCLERHAACDDPLVAVLGPYFQETMRGSRAFRYWAEPNPIRKAAGPLKLGCWYFLTGNLSMDRELFLKLGGFDERFRRYGWEDLDLGLRFELEGGRIVYDEAADAVHEHPPMPRGQLWRREYDMGWTAWQFWEKWADRAPDRAREGIFWDDITKIRVGPAWRRRLGAWLVAVTDALAPDSRINFKLYERLVYASRYAGLVDSWRANQTPNKEGEK